MPSHILEVRKFLDKSLVCHIQVATTEYQMFDRIVETDKWLRFEEWQQLYEKLDKILLVHSSPYLEKLYAQNFQISNNVEVCIEKTPLEKAYWKLCSLEKKELVPVVLNVKVSKIDVNALSKKIKNLEKVRANCKYCTSKNNIKSKDKKDLCREYDPVEVSGGGQSNVPQYKPYKPSIKTDLCTDSAECQQEKEEYSPKPVTNSSDNFEFEKNIENPSDCYNPKSDDLPDQDVPPYIPSEIKSLPDVKEEAEEISSTSDLLSPDDRINKKQILKSTRKRHHSETNTNQIQDSQESVYAQGRPKRTKRQNYNENLTNKKLFGSDDSDQEAGRRGKNKDHKSALKSARSKHKCNDADKLKEKETSKNEKASISSKENGQLSEKKLKSSKTSQSRSASVTPIKPKLTEEEKQRSRDTHEKEIEILKNYKEEIQALNKSPPAVDIITLDHLKSEELINTFEEFQPILNKHFKDHKKRKTHIITAMEDIDHLLMMTVIEDQKLLPLLNHLKTNYESNASDNMPSYTDLFMNLMLPEWLLAIFMKEHKLSRTEAIERITMQNQLETSNTSYS